MLHRNVDWRVKSTNSLNLALEFEKYRVPYRLKIFKGGDCGIGEQKEEVKVEAFGWFIRFQKYGESFPNKELYGK